MWLMLWLTVLCWLMLCFFGGMVCVSLALALFFALALALALALGLALSFVLASSCC